MALGCTRRKFLQQSTAAALAVGLRADWSSANSGNSPPMIIDTHQHLWDLSKFEPPWLAEAPDVLRKSYRTRQYLQATRSLNMKAVYMEVDVHPDQHRQEVEHIGGLCASDDHPTVAAVVGGRPASVDFKDYVRWLKRHAHVRGVRQVLHNESTGRGFCLQKEFLRGVRLLGEHGLSFDLCLRPTELADGVKLAEACPDTRLVVDHCGNADPKAFATQRSKEEPWHQADRWRRDMEALAEQEHCICKISGIIARAPEGWDASDFAPIVNHCLNVFGPDRVVFGGDWPVCLLGGSLRRWVDALSQIIAERPAEERTKLWHRNAQRWYSLRVD